MQSGISAVPRCPQSIQFRRRDCLDRTPKHLHGSQSFDILPKISAGRCPRGASDDEYFYKLFAK